MSARQPAPDREPPRERSAMFTPSRSLTPLVLAIGAAALLLYRLQNILLPFVIAAIIAYLGVPLVDGVTARTRLPRRLVALGLFFLLMGVGALLGFLGLPPLLQQVQGLLGDLHGAVEDFVRAMIGTHSVRLLGSTLDAQRLADLIIGGLQHEMSGTQLVRLIGWGAAGLSGFMLVWVLIGYFLFDSPVIAAGLLWLVPPRRRAEAEQVWHELNPLLRRYFIGVAAVVAYATVVAYFGLGLVLGLHHAVILALLTGLLEVIPIIGPLAAAVMAGLVAVEQAATPWDIWAYAGYATALRLSIDQVVGPIMLGNAARVHPVVVIFGLLAGGTLFGVVGMILAVPIALLIKVILTMRYQQPR